MKIWSTSLSEYKESLAETSDNFCDKIPEVFDKNWVLDTKFVKLVKNKINNDDDIPSCDEVLETVYTDGRFNEESATDHIKKNYLFNIELIFHIIVEWKISRRKITKLILEHMEPWCKLQI